MKKIIFVITILIIFPVMINSIYSEKTIDELLESAKVLSEQGNISEAIYEYEKVLEIDPENSFANNGKGAMLILLEEYDRAEPFVDKALEIKPKFVSALSNKAIILQFNDEKEIALEVLETALVIEPNNIDVLFNKANILKWLDVDKSIITLNKIIKLDPENKNAVDQKQNIFNNLEEVRIDGYIQMVLRDKNGSLIGYFESDVIYIRNSTFVEQPLIHSADFVNQLDIDGKKFIQLIMNKVITGKVHYEKTPSKSGISLNLLLDEGKITEIEYDPVTFRTHGYFTEKHDTIQELAQIIFPQRQPIEQISN